MSEWSVEHTEDIREVDEAKKPAAKAPFNEDDKAGEKSREGKHLPGEEKGSEGEFEHEPDRDKETAP